MERRLVLTVIVGGPFNGRTLQIDPLYSYWRVEMDRWTRRSPDDPVPEKTEVVDCPVELIWTGIRGWRVLRWPSESLDDAFAAKALTLVQRRGIWPHHHY